MSTIQTVKTQIQSLIDLANTTTGNQDTNLTDGVNALVSGFGQGGSGGSSGEGEILAEVIGGTATEVSSNLVTQVGSYGIYKQESIKSVNFPNCTTVGNYAFSQCKEMTNVSLPNCTTIGSYAFQNCLSLTSADFPNCTSVGSVAFSGCEALTSADFPKATSVAQQMFNGCEALSSVNFPLATSIALNAFLDCSNLETATFPSVTTIGNTAFKNNSKLSKVDFHSTITSIGTQVFYKCSSLEAVILRSDVVCTLSNSNAFNSTPIASGTGYIYVPSDLVETYKTATIWSVYANQFRAIEDYPEICG